MTEPFAVGQAIRALNRTGRGGRRQNPIRADLLRRATLLSMFGLLDYLGWPHIRLRRPRAERMTEKSAVCRTSPIFAMAS